MEIKLLPVQNEYHEKITQVSLSNSIWLLSSHRSDVRHLSRTATRNKKRLPVFKKGFSVYPVVKNTIPEAKGCTGPVIDPNFDRIIDAAHNVSVILLEISCTQYCAVLYIRGTSSSVSFSEVPHFHEFEVIMIVHYMTLLIMFQYNVN